jgi:hypothetical protein
MSYETHTVNFKEEQYVFGWYSTIIAIGGSMGLFLGYSLASIIVSVIDFVQKKIVT